MILLFSDEDDISTTKVIKWIVDLGQAFTRINGGEIQYLSDLYLGKKEETSLIYDGREIDIENIEAYWYRRGKLEIVSAQDLEKNTSLSKAIDPYLEYELKILEEYWMENLLKKKSIGNMKRGSLNKLLVLQAAKECGLKIPETIATGQKDKLLGFLKEHPSLICKPLFEVPRIQEDFGKIEIWTEKFDLDLLDRLGATFFPTLFQELIEKKYEIRIFYLNGKCFSNAIFSQLNEKTSIDFRIKPNGVPNRRVPFKLPEATRLKVVRLMETLNLDCGSIDLIATPDGDYVFLEINPVGQFGMTSFCGNYHLEKEIAEYLCA